MKTPLRLSARKTLPDIPPDSLGFHEWQDHARGPAETSGEAETPNPPKDDSKRTNQRKAQPKPFPRESSLQSHIHYYFYERKDISNLKKNKKLNFRIKKRNKKKLLKKSINKTVGC
jgi:hypothetical protein